LDLPTINHLRHRFFLYKYSLKLLPMHVNKETVAPRLSKDHIQVTKTPAHEPRPPFIKRPRLKTGNDKRNDEIPFKDWCMPVQPVRYIKANDYEFL
jgi:hypothetical protein